MTQQTIGRVNLSCAISLLSVGMASPGLPGCSGESAETFSNTRAALAEEVGKACIDDVEESPDFPGFSKEEINISPNSCDLGACISYHFQGRVSCPEGQEEEGTCETPSGEAVTVPVLPQLEEQPADEAVFCSCRCDGPQGTGPFCECPAGYSCEHVIDDVSLGGEWAGSYCLPEDD